MASRKQAAKLVELREVTLKAVSSGSKVDQDGGVRRVTKVTMDFEGQDEETAALLTLQRGSVLRVNIERSQAKLPEGEGESAD